MLAPSDRTDRGNCHRQDMSQVWRRRPLTTRAERRLGARHWWDARQTPLDRLLSDTEADALEAFADREAIRLGLVAVDPETASERLRGHVRPPALSVLGLFAAQQLLITGSPNAEQAALLLGLPGHHKAHAFWFAVAREARRLARGG